MEVTGLSSRTFAAWTILAGVIRLQAAYDIHNHTYPLLRSLRLMDKRLYNLTLWTFNLAWFHFTSEWFVYKTAAPGAGLLSPVIVSSTFYPIPRLTNSSSSLWNKC